MLLALKKFLLFAKCKWNCSHVQAHLYKIYLIIKVLIVQKLHILEIKTNLGNYKLVRINKLTTDLLLII